MIQWKKLFSLRGLLYFAPFLLAQACSHSSLDSKDNRDMDVYFTSGGAARFFLPELPAWANTSSTGQCHRSQVIRYLDYNSLKQEYAFLYEQSVQTQSMLNREFESFKKKYKRPALSLWEEEKIFYQTIKLIQGGVQSFKASTFEQIHLVWLDDLLKEKIDSGKFRKIIQKNNILQGFPVFVSLCMSSQELDSFLQQMNLDASYDVIGSDMFSYFNSQNKADSSESLDFSVFFSPKQKLHFYFSNSFPEQTFKGHFILHQLR